MKEIISNQDSVRSGYLDPQAAPIAEVASGEKIRYLDTWTHWGNEAKYGMSFAEREPIRHRYPKGPYAMIGPVTVTDAQPGDTIEIHLDALRPIAWGWNSFPIGVGALPEDFSEPYLHYFQFNEARNHTHFVKGVSFDLRPFIGVIALEPAGEEEVSAILAGKYGGNLVLPDFTVGTSLFLPVQKPGGRLWLGNINAREGAGVVDQTGIETAAERLELTLTRHQVTIPGPILETATHWIYVGFSQDSLDDALVDTLRGIIAWLSQVTDLSKSESYALASMVVDFHVTQYANQLHSAYDVKPPKGIHGSIPKNVFSKADQRRIENALRGVGADE